MARRGLVIEDQAACADVIAASNSYRVRATPGTSSGLPAMAMMTSGQACPSMRFSRQSMGAAPSSGAG